MTELDPIEQEIIVETGKAIANLEALIKSNERLARQAAIDAAALENLQRVIDGLEGKRLLVDVEMTDRVAGSLTDFVGHLEDATAAEERMFTASANGVVVERSLAAIAQRAREASDAEKELASTAASLGLADRDLAVLADVSGSAIFQQGEQAKTKSDKLRDLAATINVVQDSEASFRGILLDGAQAARVNAAANAAAGDAAAIADKRYRIWGTGIGVTRTALHWLVAGSMELLAVTIPALVAAGAAAGVMAEGFTWAKNALTATFTATEATSKMLHTTTGNVFGLKSALQQAQTAADPMVFELLGAAAQGAKNSFGGFWHQGLDVVHMLDTFAAHVDLALGPGGALGRQANSAISQMVSDLQGLGQVLGNVGHIVLSVATSMPGLAEVILHVAAAITGFVNAIAQQRWVSYLFTGILALEELGRWGGLAFKLLSPLVSGLGSIGVKAALAASESTIFGGALSKIAPEIVGVAGAAEGAGASMAGAAASVKGFGSALMMPFATGPGRILLLVAAMALAAYELNKMKDAAQQMAASVDDSINKATPAQGLVNMIQGINQLTNAMAQAPKTIVQVGTSFRYTGDSAQVANPQLKEYQQAISEVTQREVQLLTWNAKVGSSQYTLSQAIGLATAAGVRMNQMFDAQGRLSAIATQMIKNLINGYAAMGQTGSILSNDINAINVQTLIQQTRVQQLNQAWDSFLQMVTGGTGALGGLNSDLMTIGNVAIDATSKIQAFGKQTGGASLSVDQIARALRSFGGTSAQVWTNYNAALTQANQVTNWLRTAAATGAVTSDQYKQAIKGVVAEMLPYAKYSQTAASELGVIALQAGGPAVASFQSLSQWLGNTKVAQKNLNDTVNAATQYMSNLGQVATNLATTLNSEVANALAQGAINVKGIADAAQQFNDQLHTGSRNSWAFVGSVAGLVKQLLLAGQPIKDVTSVMDQMAQRAGWNKSQISGLNQMINNLAAALGQIHNVSATVSVNQIYTVSGQRIGPPAMPGGAAAGMLVPGSGSGDTVPAMLEPGEAVVPKRLVPHIASFLGAHGVPGFASGGIVPVSHKLTPMEIIMNEWASREFQQDKRKYGRHAPISLKNLQMLLGETMPGKSHAWGNAQYRMFEADMRHAMWPYSEEDARYRMLGHDIKRTLLQEKSQIATYQKYLKTGTSPDEAFWIGNYRSDIAYYRNLLKKEKDPYWKKIYERDISNDEKKIGTTRTYFKELYESDISKLLLRDKLKVSQDRLMMEQLLDQMGYSKGGKVPFGSYDQGGYLPMGLSLALNNTGRPEPVGRGIGVTHVHLEIGGREIANALVPDMIGSVNRYTYRNAGKATGILRPM